MAHDTEAYGEGLHAHAHEPSYSEPVRIWLILISLTVLTVAVTYVDTRHMFVAVAMLIASVKASLVLLYFMHLRYEKPLFLIMLATVFITYAIFIGLTFTDYGLRVQ